MGKNESIKKELFVNLDFRPILKAILSLSLSPPRTLLGYNKVQVTKQVNFTFFGKKIANSFLILREI